MIWIGGGAGMARCVAKLCTCVHIAHSRQRNALLLRSTFAKRAFFLDDFWKLEKEYPNFHMHLSLDQPDPVADAEGVKYYQGFAVNCIRDTYLKNHEAPEDCEYYLCGPPMLIKTVTDYLDSLGVEKDAIRFDDFG